MSPDRSDIEARLQYRFKVRAFLDEAFRHSSYVNEQPAGGLQNNERLEFLGDAVLNLAVSHMLMTRFPDMPEGDLSRMRANLVNEQQLAELARSLDLGPCIMLGKGEHQSRGWNKPSILADTFEAVTAAIYLDSGFENAYRFIQAQYSRRMPEISPLSLNSDYKSKLQELVQIRHRTMPSYELIQSYGPDHDKTFLVRIRISDFEGQGIGKSKKAAEQDAARKALHHLQGMA